jgi:SAM-dependent methyltransferase
MTDFYSRTHEDLPWHYDADLGPVIFTPYAVDIARRAAADAPARVLETACGTGIVTRALLDALPPGTVLTATDLNAELLDNARRKCRPDETVSFQPADATALPFPDGSFDTLVCQFGVMFYPDKDKGYREALRVLVPGGRYLFSVWDAHRHNPWAHLAHETVSGFREALRVLVPGGMQASIILRSPFSLSTRPFRTSLRSREAWCSVLPFSMKSAASPAVIHPASKKRCPLPCSRNSEPHRDRAGRRDRRER